MSTALARHDLTDALPSTLHIALARDSRHPKVTAPAQWHTFEKDTFDLGRHTATIEATGLTIGMYSPERCIVDALRLRGHVGYEIGREALGNWLRRPGARPAKLLMLARRIPRSEGPSRAALEFMSCPRTKC